MNLRDADWDKLWDEAVNGMVSLGISRDKSNKILLAEYNSVTNQAISDKAICAMAPEEFDQAISWLRNQCSEQGRNSLVALHYLAAR